MDRGAARGRHHRRRGEGLEDMAKFPMMPLWTDALIADTTGLDAAEFGAYLRLLIAMWRSGGYVPDDDAKLARIAGATPRIWRRIRPRIEELLIFEDGKISQGRLLDELTEVRFRSEKQRARAKARWAKPADVQSTEKIQLTDSSGDPTIKNAGNPKYLKNKGCADAAAMPKASHPYPYLTPTHGFTPPPPIEGRAREDGVGGGEPLPTIVPDDPILARASGLKPLVVEAAGIDPTTARSPARWLGSEARDLIAMWITETGLTDDQIIETVKETADAAPEPPSSLRYFTPAIQRRAQRLRDGLPTARARRPRSGPTDVEIGNAAEELYRRLGGK